MLNITRSVLLSASLIALLTLSSKVQAATYNWSNAAGGNWTTSGNWDTAGDPSTNADIAVLPNIAGAYTVALNTPRTIAELSITGSDATLNLTSTLAVDPVPLTGTSSLNAGTIDINSGTLRIVTNTFTQAGMIQASGGTLQFGYGGTGFNTNDIDTVIDWTSGADIVDPYRFFITSAAEITVNRSTAWDLLSGQTIEFGVNTPGQNVDITVLTLDQDMTNSGTISMGTSSLGYTNQFMTINSTNSQITNNADGLIEMYPRSATSLSDPWSIRRLEAELINDGEFQIHTHRGNLGKAVAGIDHINNGNITFNDDVLGVAPTVAPTLAVTGDSITNAVAGTIRGTGVLNVSAISGGLTNDGSLSPGLSAGILNVTGDVTNSSTSNLDIELGGLTLGTVNDQLTEYDQLNVSGTFNIDGELLVTLIDGFEDTITDSDSFTIVTFGDSNGSFSNVSGGRVTLTTDPFASFQVNYNAGSIVLSNFQSFVPEPSTGGMLCLGIFALLQRRRRKGQRLNS